MKPSEIIGKKLADYLDRKEKQVGYKLDISTWEGMSYLIAGEIQMILDYLDEQYLLSQ